MIRLLAALVVFAVAVAGCIAPAAPGSSADDPARPPVEEKFAWLTGDHDHRDGSLHVAEHNLTKVAYLPIDEGWKRPASFGEMDVMGNLAVVALIEPEGGFVTLDVTNPDAPSVLGRWLAGGAAAGMDVKLSPDSKLAFFATSNFLPFVNRPEAESDPFALIAGAGSMNGLHVVDVSDPARPRALAFERLGREGVHMVDLHVINGKLHAFLALPNYMGVVANGAQTLVGGSLAIYAWENGKLVHVADYVPPQVERAAGRSDDAPHDMTIVNDADLGPLMVSAWIWGVDVASVADPAKPKHLGRWQFKDAGIAGDRNVHTVMMERVDGKRVIIGTPEQYADNEVYILDATDLAKPVYIGGWKLPVEEPLAWPHTLHNFYVLDGRMYVAHWHAGAWVLDVSRWEHLASPPILAYFMPTEDASLGWSFFSEALPMTFDMIPAKGRVMITDLNSGFYVLETPWTIPDVLPYGTRGA